MIERLALSDPRYRKYAAKYGHVAVELDALHPSDLESMIRTAIENELDMNDFYAQRQAEQYDFLMVDRLRSEVLGVVNEKIAKMFD